MLASQVVLVAKNPPANAEDTRDMGLIPALGIPLEEEIATTPLFLPGKFHGQKNLLGYSPWGHRVGYEHTHTHHACEHSTLN